MYAVDSYAAVRRFIFVEGKSRREAARVFGLSRDTISKMCRYSAPPGYVRTKPPGKPKLGAFIPVIDAILAADVTAPPKQRHSAKRIYERLCSDWRTLPITMPQIVSSRPSSNTIGLWAGFSACSSTRPLCE